MNLVQKACDNVTKGTAGADVQRFYPLTIFDLKPVLLTNVIPLLIAFAMTNGVLVIGVPGVGKTVLACIMAMTMGRFQCRTKNLGPLASQVTVEASNSTSFATSLVSFRRAS